MIPIEQIRELPLPARVIEWLASVEDRLTELEDLAQINAGALMPVAGVEIATAYVTGTVGSPQTILTAAAQVGTIIERIVVCNPDSSAQTLSVWLVPSGGSVSDATLVIDAQSIAAGTTVEMTALENRRLNPGSSLRVGAGTASKVTLGGSYVQRTRG